METSDFTLIMDYLKSKGSEQTVKTYKNHGATNGELFGVKVADLKPMVKKYKNQNDLAIALYNSKNSDAMYLAALMCNPKTLTKETLQNWMNNAWWYMLSEYAAAWVVAESSLAMELVLENINSKEERLASCAWSALSSYLSITDNNNIDGDLMEQLLEKVVKEIHISENRVRYTMNGFVIALASYYLPLNLKAKEAASKIGKVDVFMGETACKVPDALVYIQKVESAGKLGIKKKQARC